MFGINIHSLVYMIHFQIDFRFHDYNPDDRVSLDF